MSKNSSRSQASRIRVRVQPRQQVDLQRLARAVIELAMQDHDPTASEQNESKCDGEAAA